MNIFKKPIIYTVIYFSVALSLMFFMYPHEDALILYRYVENFVAGGQIAFNIDDLHTEGATDFLWFLTLSFFNFFGINVILSAILLNTISIYFLINSIQKIFLKNENLLTAIIIIFIFLNIGPIIGSSLYGFSTLFFITLGFNCYLSSISKNFSSWTIFSILFCLTRPEGVFLFLPTIIIIFSLSSLENRYKFYKSLALVTIIGLSYFVWRYFYFNNLLPLPLVVKSIGGETSLTRMAALGIQILNSFLLTLLLLTIYSFVRNFKKIFINNKNLILFIFTIFIWIIFLFFLSRGFLSQNIFDRYFASFYFIIFITFLYSFIFLNKIEKNIALIFIIIASFDGSNILTRILTEDKRKFNNSSYVVYKDYSNEGGWGDHPLIKVGKSLSEKKLTIMLTEAGAIPYLSKKSFVYDMNGLNTNIFSKRPVNCKDIDKISPDIIEIDVGPLNWGNKTKKPSHLTTFSWSSFRKSNKYSDCGFNQKKNIYEDFVDTDNINLIKKFKKTNKDNHYNATIVTAPNNVLFCLFDNNNYQEIFMNKKSDQIYFVKKNLNFNFLDKSCNIKKSGYFRDLLNK